MINNNRNRDKIAIVSGVGGGLGEALCHKLMGEGYQVAGLSRRGWTTDALENKCFMALSCDVSDKTSVDTAIAEVEACWGSASVYIHNAAYLYMGGFLQTRPQEFTDLWEVICLGAVHGVQRVLPAMLAQKSGTVLVTGATASIKAGAGFAAFSSAKFALRGLIQSLAREYGAQGVHFAHILIDGLIWGEQAKEKFAANSEDCLQPDAIAESYFHLIQQPHSCWTQELDLRPDREVF